MTLDNYARLLSKHLININDISHLVADINYTHIYLKNGSSVLFSYTMKRFEELLASAGIFKRIHRGVIINTSQIVLVEDNNVTLKTGHKYAISRRRTV